MAQEQTGDLCKYISEQVQRYGLVIERRNGSFCFDAHRHKITLTPEFEPNGNNLLACLKVEVIPYEHDKWVEFLKKLKGNAILCEGGELYLKERFEKLKKYEEILARMDKIESNDSKLVCLVRGYDECVEGKNIDKLIKQKELFEAFFELLVRPVLWFAYSHLKE